MAHSPDNLDFFIHLQYIFHIYIPQILVNQNQASMSEYDCGGTDRETTQSHVTSVNFKNKY